jgi:predicted permease
VLSRLRSTLSALFRRTAFEAAMAEEMDFHLSQQIADLVATGIPADDAERQARAAFGSMATSKDSCRQARVPRWFDELRQDLRYAARGLRRAPVFTAIVTVTIAIAIGANTAVFSVVEGVLLAPFPYAEPDRLVLLFEQPASAPSKFGFSAPDYEAFPELSRSFSGLAAYRSLGFELSGTGSSQRVTGLRVSPSLVGVLGVGPAIGRWITEDDDRRSARVAVLTDALWARAFGRDPSVVGRSIELDREAYTVVGVMPRRFAFPPRGGTLNNMPADVFVPMAFSAFERQGFDRGFNNSVVGRLAPGVSVDQARAEAVRLVPMLVARYPPAVQPFAAGASIPVVPLRDDVVGPTGRMLSVLMAAVALVLVIACADLSTLLLGRSLARQREMSVRSALGAGRARLARQLMTEAAVLSIAGTAAGLLLAYWSMHALVGVAGRWLPMADSVAFDRRVLAYAVLLMVATPLVFGALPAVRLFTAESGAMSDDPRTATAGRAQSRWVGVLVVAQLALALVLATGAGLLIRSFVRLMDVSPGFRAERAVNVIATLPAAQYRTGRQIKAFYDQEIAAVRETGGVSAVGAGNDLPLDVMERRAFSGDGSAQPLPEAGRMGAVSWIAGDYFEALGMPVKRGRPFTDADTLATAPVVIVNELLARMLWGDRDPIGRQIKWGIDASSPAPWMTIVGVVGDAKQTALSDPTLPQVYMPLAQENNSAFVVAGQFYRTVNLIARTSRELDGLVPDLRAAIHRVDPALPITSVEPLSDWLAASVAPQRFSTTIVLLFAAAALALAAIGICGVLLSAVSRHSHEIAVRIALGATTAGVVGMVLRRVASFAAIGIGLGIASSLAATRLMAGLLFEVDPTDAIAISAAAAAVAAACLVASLAPAWHAARIDPLVALRLD